MTAKCKLDVRAAAKKVNKNLKLSDDAFDLVEAMLEQMFRTIAKKANDIVERANKEGISGEEVKKAVTRVFKKMK